MNLVGPGEIEDHYVDCARALAPLEDPPFRPIGRWVDLGSGAGFPGIVFAALHAGEGCAIELVDVRRKRCIFLEHVLARAEVGAPDVVVRCARAEELEPGQYTGVVARAFAPPADVLRHAARLLAPGGLVVLFLQEEQAVASGPDFTEAFERRYEVAGRQRRSVGLRRLP